MLVPRRPRPEPFWLMKFPSRRISSRGLVAKLRGSTLPECRSLRRARKTACAAKLGFVASTMTSYITRGSRNASFCWSSQNPKARGMSCNIASNASWISVVMVLLMLCDLLLRSLIAKCNLCSICPISCREIFAIVPGVRSSVPRRFRRYLKRFCTMTVGIEESVSTARSKGTVENTVKGRVPACSLGSHEPSKGDMWGSGRATTAVVPPFWIDLMMSAVASDCSVV
mmetsp:Transcript_35382/g.63247  ORF Transcript_35382/g.63247 Transcript_35382/m.63247 type:complete len:227 (+) Transcript_35382:1561-2241(+)